MEQPLFAHQTAGALRIAAAMPTYLGFDMGIGKTRTFIEAVKARKAERVLVICPASAVLVWKREIDLWHFDASYVVVRTQADFRKAGTYYIVSHGLMSQKNGPIPERLTLGPRYALTAVDEAHAFNAADSNRVKALRRAAPKLGQIVPLSGTPMKNHAGDLFTLIDICWPQGLKMSRHEYEEKFCRVTHKYLRWSQADPCHRGLQEFRCAQETDRPLHDAGAQGGRVQGPAAD